MSHPTPAEIEEHLSRREGSLDEHLETCIECAHIARSIKSFGDLLTWEIALLPEPPAVEDTFQSEALWKVRQLLEGAEKLRHADPARAVEICNQLLALQECSTETEEGRHLSVLVLRERANALRFLGELKTALKTISHARTLADDLIVSDYENAVLDYIEATVLFEQDKLEAAENLAKRAETTLRDFGDIDRTDKARMLVASVQFAKGDSDRARIKYLEILESIEGGENRALQAGLLHNLADTEISLGRFAEAGVHTKQAAELYRSLGMITELTRLKWNEARMAVAMGELERAELGFHEVESAFLETGLKLDASLVSLELLELHESQGRREQVVEIATRLASVFAEAGAQLGLATALATLRDAAVRGEDVMAPVSVARTTIEELMSANS